MTSDATYGAEWPPIYRLRDARVALPTDFRRAGQKLDLVAESTPYLWKRKYTDGDQQAEWGGWSLEHFIADHVEHARQVWRVVRNWGWYVLNLGDTRSNCVDTETEALTTGGWKSWDQLRVGDSIMTLNPATYLAEWGIVEAVNINPPEPRRMLSLEGRGHSSMSTHHHRWYTERRTGRASTRRYVREVVDSEHLTSEHRVPIAAPVVNLPAEAKWDDALVELVAWHFTEGHDRKPGVGRTEYTGIYIAQSTTANPENVARIEQCLYRLFGPPVDRLPGVKGADPTWRKCMWPSSPDKAEFRLNAAAARIVRECCTESKCPRPEWLASLTRAQIELFIDAAVAADGWLYRHGGRPTIGFAQVEKDRADAFQMALILSGRGASMIREKHRPGWSSYGTRDRWLVIQRHNQRIKPSKYRPTWVIHDGIVWCPTTNNGSWLARRNGQVFFTGNTGGAGGDANAAGQRIYRPGDVHLAGAQQIGVPWRVAIAIQDRTDWRLQGVIVWDKKRPVRTDNSAHHLKRNRRPGNQHEFLFMFTKPGAEGKAPHWDPTYLESIGVRGDVWQIATSTVRPPWASESDDTPPWPDELVKRLVLTLTKPGDRVADFVAGYGTTARVAREHGRVGYAFDPFTHTASWHPVHRPEPVVEPELSMDVEHDTGPSGCCATGACVEGVR